MTFVESVFALHLYSELGSIPSAFVDISAVHSKSVSPLESAVPVKELKDVRVILINAPHIDFIGLLHSSSRECELMIYRRFLSYAIVV